MTRSNTLVVPVILICILSLAAMSCATNDPHAKAKAGALGGAAAGGLIASAAGANTAGIVGGVILGGLVGGAIGDSLDRRDRELAYQASQRAFENGQTGYANEWRNPDSGHYGTVTPTRTYQDSYGAPCREYTQEIWIDGQRHESYGTACRGSDGAWKVQN